MSLQKKATLISSVVAFLLLVMKFAIGILSGSIAVLSSAIDSLLDLFVSLFNYFAVSSSEKKEDGIFNYGRGKIEALAALFEGLIITFSGFFIFYTAVLKLIGNEKVEYLSYSIGVMIISVIITGFLVYFLEKVAKQTENIVIHADSLHYKTDLYSNLVILLGLVIIHFSGFYIIDAILGIIISLYIIYSAFDLIKKGYGLLLDISLDKEEIDQIIKIIDKQALITSYHELKTRQSGHRKFVEIHLVFTPEIKLIDAHRISDHVEYAIPKINKNFTRNVMIHLDPYCDSRE
ncbi:cation transporter [Candidatus Gracilibacteria bacterium 28_42_T64]|nr:cation transporter [Candidatus Gracilibacteria bacterium 28_42_T64]